MLFGMRVTRTFTFIPFRQKWRVERDRYTDTLTIDCKRGRMNEAHTNIYIYNNNNKDEKYRKRKQEKPNHEKRKKEWNYIHSCNFFPLPHKSINASQSCQSNWAASKSSTWIMCNYEFDNFDGFFLRVHLNKNRNKTLCVCVCVWYAMPFSLLH